MERKWWHDKIAYQIYPKSFYDSNGDGIGDIPGIIMKLDYLKELGVDILWLSPIYKSPLADEGYDIADYYEIDPRFGTMEDMEKLIFEAKKRDMYILMDLVVNHCSDEHEWFKEACREPSGKYGKFFYIRDKNPDGSNPTNWRSYFGGPCWDTLPGHEEKVYLHVFHKKQPDLNWENPALREEVYKNINWWLDKGIGGFRIDAIINIKKPETFRNYNIDRSDGLSHINNMLSDARGIGVFLKEMRDHTFRLHDSFSVGEVFNEKEDEILNFIGEDGYFSSMFDFEPEKFGHSKKGWYDRKVCTPEEYKECIFKSQERVGNAGFLSNIIENHDEPRGVSRYIPPEELSIYSKKALALVYFMLRGIPFIYQGQEIGMENKTFKDVKEFDDINTIHEYKVALDALLSEKKALQVVSKYSRDNARTPVQWSKEANAGFSSGTPWLPVNENYNEINVEESIENPDSLFHFYHSLIKLRKDPEFKDTLVYGDFSPYRREDENLISYLRTHEGQRLLIISNMQLCGRSAALPGGVKRVLINNYPSLDIRGEFIFLKGYQAVVLELIRLC